MFLLATMHNTANANTLFEKADIEIPTSGLLVDDFTYDSISAGWWTESNDYLITQNNTIDNGILVKNDSGTWSGHNGWARLYRRGMNVYEKAELEIVLNFYNYSQKTGRTDILLFGEYSGVAKQVGVYFFHDTNNVKITFQRKSGGFFEKWYYNAYMFQEWYKLEIEWTKQYVKWVFMYINGSKVFEHTEYNPYEIFNPQNYALFSIHTLIKNQPNWFILQIDYIKTNFAATKISKSGSTSSYDNLGIETLKAKSTGATGTYDVHVYLLFEDLIAISAVAFADIYTASGYDEIGFEIEGFDGSTWVMLAHCSFGYDGGATRFYWGSGGDTALDEGDGFGVQLWYGKDGYWHYEYVKDDDADGEYTIVADDSDMVLDDTKYYAYRIEVFGYLDSLNGQSIKIQYNIKTGTTYSEKPNYFAYETSEPSYQPPSVSEPDAGILGGVGDFVAGSLTWLFTGIYNLASFIYVAIANILLSIPALVWSFFETILNDIYNAVTALPNQIWSLFESILTDIYNAVTALPSQIWSYFETILNDIYSELQSLAGDIWAYFETILNDIYTELTNLAANIWSYFETILSDIYDEIVALAGNIWSYFESILNNIYSAITAIAGDIWNWIMNQYPAVQTFFSNLATWIQAAIDFFGDLYNFVWDVWALLTENMNGFVAMFEIVAGSIYFLINNAYLITVLGIFAMAFLPIYIIYPVLFEDGTLVDIVERTMIVVGWIEDGIALVAKLVHMIISAIGHLIDIV